MKKSIILLALFWVAMFFWSNKLCAQYEGWRQKGPSPAFKIEDQKLIGVGTHIAVGEAGKVVKTSDGGDTWINLASGTTNNLHSISIPDGSTGYMVGDLGTIICTTGAGANWFNLVSGTT